MAWPLPSVRVLVATVAIAAGMINCDRAPTEPAAARAGGIRGITFVDWTADGYARPDAMTSMDALASTKANTVVIVVTAYQASPSSNVVHTDDARTPTPAAVAQAVARAQALGLSVCIKPHVDLEDGSARSRIDPASPAEWFDSYRAFILAWASFAAGHGAKQFVVGVELGGTLKHADQWRETIRQVRNVFPGEITYAASWDEAGIVPFWRDLDFMGIDFYFPVAGRAHPGRLEILAGWQPWLERLHLLSRQTGRRILLTEIGYRSVDGAGMHPFSVGNDAPIDLGGQADLYWAALEAVASESWMAGLCWWDWPADASGGPGDNGFTPRGKPAQSEISNAWSH